MLPIDYMTAARVPKTVEPQTFGLWILERRPPPPPTLLTNAGFGVDVGWPDYTLLRRWTEARMHLGVGQQEIVMEDSLPELRKHLPIWLHAHGRVLITGLGLGCVVRGLLASPAVEHIDVVELDGQILNVIGREFKDDPRVSLHHANALSVVFMPGTKWDFAWHDIWCEGNGLHVLHTKLIGRFMGQCKRQGAWQYPRSLKRLCPDWFLR